MRANLEHTVIDNSLLKAGNKLGQLSQTLGGTFTGDADMPHVWFLDPGGAGRTVLLPPEAKGLFYLIVNTADGDEDLTVKEDSNTTTIGIVSRGGVLLFNCDGTSWYSSAQAISDILDFNGNEVIIIGATASAVNEVTITNAATGSGPEIAATGGDSNVDLLLTAKGTGAHVINNGTDPVMVKLMGAAGGFTNEIADLNGNEILGLQGVASAVNEFTITNAAASGTPAIAAQGGDTNIGVKVDGKGSGVVSVATVSTGGVKVGVDATDAVALKGVYMNPSAIAVTVPAITDPDIAKVDINVATAFSMQPAVGDAVIAIPQEAMETNARILGCYVTGTDQITLVFGSEGGNVTGGNKNFKFLVLDLT